MNLEIVPFFQTLLLLSLKAAVLILAILAVRALFGHRLHPAWRHAMWGLVPLQLLLFVSMPSAMSVYNLIPQNAEPEVVEVSETVSETNIEPSENDITIPLSRGERGMPNEPLGASGSFEAPTLTQCLLTVWLLGVAVMALLFLRQTLLCRRWLREAELIESEAVLHLFKNCAKKMNVRTWLVMAESRSVTGPLLIGAIRPALLLPRGLIETATHGQLQTIFLHELAHLKRWDVWTGWLMTFLLTLHWFNPLLWLAVRKMNADREEACDALALRTLEAAERPDYGRALIDIAQHFVTPARTPGLVGISDGAYFSRGKNLTRRIEMIGHNRSWKFHWHIVAAALTLLLGLVLVTDAREPLRMSQTDEKTKAQLLTALPGSYLGMEGDDRFGIVVEKPSPDGIYPITLYEDGLPGQGYDAEDDDRYLGTATVTKTGLSVKVDRKFDGPREEAVEKTLRTLEIPVSYVERSAETAKIGSIVLEIEKNREWNAVKVMRDLPAPLTVPAASTPLPEMKEKPLKRIVGSYLGTEGDDRFGIVIEKPSPDGGYPITLYEDGLPGQGHDPNDDDKYIGTATFSDDQLDIRLTKKFDGRREERVESVLQNLTATLHRIDDETNSKGFYMTIPRNREWDAVRVEPVPDKIELKAIASAEALPGDYLGWEDDDRIGIRIGKATNPDGVFPITVYENGLPGQGYDPNDDDRYEGTATFKGTSLEISLLKKFDENFEEPVERALRKLTATVGLENGKVTIFIPANREWDDVKVTKISE